MELYLYKVSISNYNHIGELTVSTSEFGEDTIPHTTESGALDCGTIRVSAWIMLYGWEPSCAL